LAGVVSELQRDAPVEEIHLAVLADHDVRGLQVAVDDTARVAEVNDRCDLHQRSEVPLEWIADVEERT
jgi:hypothetical protein